MGMESVETDDRHVFVRSDRGDVALESITEASERHGIDTGVVASGIGTLKPLNVHYVDRTDFPERSEDPTVDRELEGAWEVTSIDGVVADGEPHLHVTAFDGERTVGDHLEPGPKSTCAASAPVRLFRTEVYDSTHVIVSGSRENSVFGNRTDPETRRRAYRNTNASHRSPTKTDRCPEPYRSSRATEPVASLRGSGIGSATLCSAIGNATHATGRESTMLKYPAGRERGADRGSGTIRDAHHGPLTSIARTRRTRHATAPGAFR